MTHVLSRGGNVGLSQVGLSSPVVVTLTWNPAPGIDADLSAFLCAETGKVRNDEDFIFYNQPEGGNGAVKHLGKTQRGSATVDRISINVAALPTDIEKVVIGASLDGNGGFGGLTGLGVEVAADENSNPAIRAELDATTETGMVFAEVYLRNGEWKVRAVGQGYTNGLSGLATDFGVSVDDDPAPAASAPTQAAPATPPISMEKKRLINLEKDLTNKGDTKMLSLVKTAGVSLEKKGLGEHTARVAWVLDISGSMSDLFRSGAVQALAERVLALALRFDDDGEVDVFLFGEHVHRPEGLSLNGYKEYIADIIRRHRLEGYTMYGKAMKAVREHYFNNSRDRGEPLSTDVPVYVMFITDGRPSDQGFATKQIKAASYEPIFWKFMAIGDNPSEFSYLKKLDDEVKGRFTDNADFFSVTPSEVTGRNPISDDALFDLLMEEYPDWLRRARSNGLLR